MTITSIEAILSANISNGNLLLTTSTLQSENIQSLFKNILSGQPLEIKSAKLTTSTDSLIVKGKTNAFSISGLETEARFYLNNQKPELNLTFSLPKSWKFTQSFPSLATSILTHMEMEENDFLLDKLSFSQAKLILESSEMAEPDRMPRIQFAANLTIDDDLLPLNQFIKVISPVNIFGSIIPTSKGTEIFLNTPISGDINLGYLQVPFLELDFVADVIDQPESGLPPYTSAYFALETEVQIGNKQDALQLPLYTTFWGAHQDLSFEADLADFSLENLSRLTGLLGGIDLAEYLPEGYHPDQALALSRLTFNISPDQKKLKSVALSLSSVKAWSITDQVLIDDISIYFLVSDPSNAETRSLICDISGNLKVGNLAQFQIGASLPDFVMGGSLIQGSNLNLKELIQYLAVDQVSIPEGFPQVTFSEMGIMISPKDRSFSLSGSATTDWEIIPKKLKLQNVETNFEVNRLNGKTSISGLLLGNLLISGTEVFLIADIEEKLTLKGGISQLNLSAILEEFLELVELPTDLPDFVLNDIEVVVTPKTGEFRLSGQSAHIWQIPLGINGLEVEAITFRLERAPSLQPGAAARKPGFTGVITGTIAIGATEFKTDYYLPGNFVLTAEVPSFSFSALIQELCGSEVIRDLSVPASVLALSLSDLVVAIAPQQKSFSISANSSLGQIELVIKQIANRWGFAAGFILPSTWRFSSIANELSVLDGLRFPNAALILASVASPDFALSTIQSQSKSINMIKGLNFVSSIDMSGTGVDALLDIKSLNVSAAVGGKLTDFALEASIDSHFDLGQGVTFGNIKFRLMPAPSNFSLTLDGTLNVITNDSVLQFEGGMEVKPRAAEFQGTMKGIWQDAFNTRGVSIANVAVEVGISYPPLLPIIGIAGTLQIGDFQGAVAVKFDSGRSMLAIAFNRLYFMDVLRTFCGTEVARAIPAELTKTILDIGFEDVKVYIVPQTTMIGNLPFEQGFHLEGKMQFWGLRAYAYLDIDYLSGIEVKAEMDAIVLPGLFKLTGADSRTNPSLYLKISPSNIPTVDISAAVEILGIRRDVQIRLSDQGFYFKTSGKIFDLFECSLEVTGQSFGQGGNFSIIATMHNDLLEYLRREASAAIQAAATKATQDLTNAQADVAKAQRDVDTLNETIRMTRLTIQQERDRDSQRMRDAQAAVQGAQNDVYKLDRDIAAVRQTIQQERYRDSQRIRDAQAAVQKAQNDVYSLQWQIDSFKDRIEVLKQDIRDKQAWFDNSAWWEQSFRWAELSGVATAKGAEIAGLYTAIGGVEAAKGTAMGVLEAAKQVVRSLEGTIVSFPIDADFRIAGLFTARETANGILEGTKQVVRSLENTIVSFPIDADFRIAGLLTARETATGSLYVATQILEGLKITVGAMADVAQFIVNVGLGGLLDVKYARFAAGLSAMQGGAVSLELTIVFMQRSEQNLALAFNFYDPLSGAKELAKQLLPSG